MLLRLPRSTLFPYTTLFRSRLHWNAAVNGSARHRRVIREALNLVVDLRRELARGREDQRAGDAVRKSLADRKSTRLNSSHTVTSYAVFCLKKKKTTRWLEAC